MNTSKWKRVLKIEMFLVFKQLKYHLSEAWLLVPNIH